MITRPDGSFLLGQRPAGKVYAGYWEFPGGKIEAGEAPLPALKRELHEELGIEVETAYPWLTRDYDYAHAAVRLRFFRVVSWSGNLHGRESQRFAWQLPDAISVDPLLPANAPILRALRLAAGVCDHPRRRTGSQRSCCGGSSRRSPGDSGSCRCARRVCAKASCGILPPG